MKKKFFLMALTSLFAALTISSCSKDDDKPSALDSLVGTEWVYEDDGYEQTFEFTSKTKGTCTEKEDGKSASSTSFTYSYEKPDVSLEMVVYNYQYGYEEEVEISGVVEGDEMTFDYDGDEVVFTKK